jgi:hypothetical protein
MMMFAAMSRASKNDTFNQQHHKQHVQIAGGENPVNSSLMDVS